MNSETLAAYTGPVQINLSQMESQPQEGEVVPMPNQEASLINNHSQRKNEFVLWSLTGETTHTQGQAPCLAVDGQHKTNSVHKTDTFLQTF